MTRHVAETRLFIRSFLTSFLVVILCEAKMSNQLTLPVLKPQTFELWEAQLLAYCKARAAILGENGKAIAAVGLAILRVRRHRSIKASTGTSCLVVREGGLKALRSRLLMKRGR
eukprot:GHVR01053520.1.p1 GENE.GHVR01053520.1~~GHVR01053520.1.p1  ORF type:complete len:114 (-),score=3.28 GHVR01053520.1:444-785(-)